MYDRRTMNGACCRALTIVAVLSACGDGGGFPDARPIDSPPAGGTMSLQWRLTDEGGADVTCAQVGAQTVTLTLRNRAAEGGSTELFTCDIAAATTPPVTPGVYDVTIELTGPAGTLATLPRVMGVTVTSGQNSPLPMATFVIDATGGLDISFFAVPAGDNCTGAGITGMTIALERTAGGACEPVTFAISAGSGTAGSYTVNCATPASVGCLHADQRLTVTGVPSNTYTIRVRGTSAGGCWLNDDIIPVPTGGATTIRQLNLARAVPPGPCP